MKASIEERARLRAGGGPGSGNFGHAGRPGEVGGSGGGGGSETDVRGDFTQYKPGGKSYDPTVKVTRGSPGGRIPGHGGAFMRSVPAVHFKGPGGHFVVTPSMGAMESGVGRFYVEDKRGQQFGHFENSQEAYAAAHKWAKEDQGFWPPPAGSKGPSEEWPDEKPMRKASLEDRAHAMSMKGAGGPGSGNFGHSGRPGEVGGSGEGGGGNLNPGKTPKQRRAYDAGVKAAGGPIDRKTSRYERDTPLEKGARPPEYFVAGFVDNIPDDVLDVLHNPSGEAAAKIDDEWHVKFENAFEAHGFDLGIETMEGWSLQDAIPPPKKNIRGRTASSAGKASIEDRARAISAKGKG